MAVDTREKRASTFGFLLNVLPLPLGVPRAQGTRQQVSWVYRGIFAGPPNPVVQRQAVTSAQLLDLEVRQRAETVRWELLDASLQPIGELHPVLGASIDANTESTYARALRNLTLIPDESADIDTFTSRVKPYWVLETGDEYPLGVFMFQGRDRQLRTWGGLTVCSLLVDQTWILDQPCRYSYTIDAGSLLSDHLIALAAAAGIVDLTGIEGSAIIAPDHAFKVAGTSRRQIMAEICDLLAFYPPYFDNNGKLICRSVPNLDLATADHVYNLGDVSRIIADSATESDDAWSAPNVYVVVNTSASASPIVGSYEIPSDAPNSVLHRGFEVVRVINAPGAQDSDQATAMAKAAYAQDRGALSVVEFDAPPDPRHDLFAVVEFDEVNYREPAWNLTCAPGGPHHHSLRGIFN